MSRPSPKHDAVWARQFAAELKLRGHPAKRLLAQVGLDERSLNADGARISFAKHAAFFELAAEVTGDSCLGLHFGQTRDTRDAGLIGYVGLSSPTLMDAIKNWTCRGKVPVTYLIQAALRSNLSGLFPLRAECRLRGL